MEKWEQAAQSFISRFENEKYFAGRLTASEAFELDRKSVV